MAITATDVLFRLATTAGAAGNAAAQADPNASLGKYLSTTDLAAGMNSLFDNITGTENAANDIEYRCLFIFNNHASLIAQAVTVYISAEVAGGASVAIAADTTAASAKGSATAQALQIANESTAPAGLTFSSPTTAATGIVLGDIPAGSCRAFWVRRTAANSAALDADGVTLAYSLDTAA